MATHRIRKGLDLPLVGVPEQRVDEAARASRVALLASDYVGLRPGMKVAVGDTVRKGDPLFEHKRITDVSFTSPAGGTVVAVERGAKRALQSVVVQVEAGAESERPFSSFTGRHPSACSGDDVRALLLESGLWTALRERPFGVLPDPSQAPHSLFVTVADSNPLAPDPAVVLAGRQDDFERGLYALAKLGEGPVWVCQPAGSPAAVPAQPPFRNEEFVGPHPSGTVGLHIHALDPVDRNKRVWYIGAQDVVAIGALFESGKLDVRRVVALGGPSVLRPRLLQTRLGASLDEMLANELAEGPHRVVSGSVLSGRRAEGPVLGYLGRYHQQVSVLPEAHGRKFLGWLAPGADRFSASRTFLSRLLPGRRFAMDTSMNGSDRAIVPIGLYEKVVPLDLQPSFLLRALVMDDIERAEELGVLELEEEDLGLCTFVCPSKTDYGVHLRRVLQTIEKEG